MAITRQKKASILSDLRDHFARHEVVVFVTYRGTNVKDVNALRVGLRNEGLDYQVAKRRLVEIAAKNANNITIDPNLFQKVPFGCVFGYEDQISACKVAHTFSKKFETVQILGGIIDGKVVDKDVIMQYANLPSREELLATLVGLMRAPLTSLHGSLRSGLSNFAYALSEVAKQKETSA